MIPIEFVTIGVLSLFSLVLLIYTMYFVKEKGKYLRYDDKKPPSIKYLRSRIKVASLFEGKFNEIIVVAKHFLQARDHLDNKIKVTKSSAVEIQTELKPMNENDIELAGYDLTEGNQNVDELEKCLKQKIVCLYEAIVQKADDKGFMHKLSRFEIKSRCILHPHDIFGSQISKTIEDIYQEIIDEKERNLQPNAIARFFKSVKSKIDYLTNMIIDKLQLQKRNLPWFVVSIIVMMSCIFLIFHTNPWKGAILIVSLTLALSIYLWIMRRKSFYSQFTWLSLIYHCTSTTYSTLFWYLCDIVTDVQVAAIYFNIFFCIIASDEYKQEYYLVFQYLKALLNSEIDYLTPAEKLAGTIILFTAWIILFYTFSSLIWTIWTCGICFTFKTKLKLSLLIGGTLKSPDNIAEISRPNQNDKKKEMISTESLIHRNELIIEQAHFESFIQFIIQWSAYFFLVYWTDLVEKVNEQFYKSPGAFNVTLDVHTNRISKAVMEREKDVCKLDSVSSFGVLWKSGFTSLMTFTTAFYIENSLQHELSLGFLQKLFYRAASFCSAWTFFAIALLMLTAINDIIMILTVGWGILDVWNVIVGTMELCILWCILVIGTFFLIKFFVTIWNYIITRFMLKTCIGEHVDNLWSNTSIGYTFVYFYALLESFRLPPSHAMRPGFRRRYQLSYHHKNSPQLINSYIRHYILISFTTFTCALWLGFSMLLITYNETLSRISVKIDIYPSEISDARFRFLVLSCITIPIGFILANVFLYLYFKFDGGFFSGVNIQFHYKWDKKSKLKLREPCVANCLKMSNSVACCGCCEVTLLDPAKMGDWVDITSLEKDENDFANDAKESEIENRLNLSQSERMLFEGIKKSIPFYRGKM